MAVSAFLAEIQLTYNQFTKTEKKIADYILKEADKVLFMSITDLAEACKVADASVSRFCRTIGVKGYQEFKMKLSLSYTLDDTSKNQDITDEQGQEKKFDLIMERHIEALRETRKLLDRVEVEKTIEFMERAERIFFFGVGGSLLVAQIAAAKFMRITNKVSCIVDPHMQAMVASMTSEKDLFVFVSYSGATIDNVHVAKMVKDAGAKIVTVTRFLKSPLTAYTDALLLCGSDESPLDGGALEVKTGQLFIIDVLFNEYYNRNETVCKLNNRKTSKAVVEKLF